MSYEINVKVINQQTPVYLEKPMSILLQNEIDDADINAYAEIWSFFQICRGFCIL